MSTSIQSLPEAGTGQAWCGDSQGASNPSFYHLTIHSNVRSEVEAPVQHLGSLMKHLKHHINTLTRLCHPSPSTFLNDFTTKLLIKLHDPSPCVAATSEVEKNIALFESLHEDIILLENNILAVVGYGGEIEMLHDALRRVNHIVTCLEELHCYCSEGSEMLKEEYVNGHLGFQK
jgi:hypothetical protein